LNEGGYVKVVGKESQSYVYVLVELSGDNIKDEIKLSELDEKILKFNYDYDDVIAILNTYDTPLDIFSRSKPTPVWNDYLPESDG
jgi:hypothetical protein